MKHFFARILHPRRTRFVDVYVQDQIRTFFGMNADDPASQENLIQEIRWTRESAIHAFKVMQQVEKEQGWDL